MNQNWAKANSPDTAPLLQIATRRTYWLKPLHALSEMFVPRLHACDTLHPAMQLACKCDSILSVHQLYIIGLALLSGHVHAGSNCSLFFWWKKKGEDQKKKKTHLKMSRMMHSPYPETSTQRYLTFGCHFRINFTGTLNFWMHMRLWSAFCIAYCSTKMATFLFFF